MKEINIKYFESRIFFPFFEIIFFKERKIKTETNRDKPLNPKSRYRAGHQFHSTAPIAGRKKGQVEVDQIATLIKAQNFKIKEKSIFILKEMVQETIQSMNIRDEVFEWRKKLVEKRDTLETFIKDQLDGRIKFYTELFESMSSASMKDQSENVECEFPLELYEMLAPLSEQSSSESPCPPGSEGEDQSSTIKLPLSKSRDLIEKTLKILKDKKSQIHEEEIRKINVQLEFVENQLMPLTTGTEPGSDNEENLPVIDIREEVEPENTVSNPVQDGEENLEADRAVLSGVFDQALRLIDSVLEDDDKEPEEDNGRDFEDGPIDETASEDAGIKKEVSTEEEVNNLNFHELGISDPETNKSGDNVTTAEAHLEFHIANDENIDCGGFDILDDEDEAEDDSEHLEPNIEPKLEPELNLSDSVRIQSPGSSRKPVSKFKQRRNLEKIAR